MIKYDKINFKRFRYGYCGSLDHLSLRRNIVLSYFLALWEPKPGTRAVKFKPKTQHLGYRGT